MTEAEKAIFEKLNPCRKAVAKLLYHCPTSRNLTNDDFISAFRKTWTGQDFTSETIGRCRRFVQHTCKLWPKDGDALIWKKAIKELEKEAQLTLL